MKYVSEASVREAKGYGLRCSVCEGSPRRLFYRPGYGWSCDHPRFAVGCDYVTLKPEMITLRVPLVAPEEGAT